MSIIKPLFSLKNVGVVLDGKEILSGVTLDIRRGEYIGVIGPNGGGKTTLLRVLLGLSRPTHGTVTRQILPAKIGYVPQRMNGGDRTFPASVTEIVASGIINPVSSSERERRVHSALATTHLLHVKHQRIGTLSGGESQRTLIARALAGEPDVLFLDEPMSAVDPGSQEEFYAFLRKLHVNGLTIVMVSHDTDAIAHEVERVICLNRHLVCHGSPEDTLHHFEHYGH